MDIRQLRYFVAIAESESLSKAGERLNVAQPALSVHLANLENELGVRLVERTHRGIKLTSAGEVLYERALVSLQHHNETLSIFRHEKSARKKNINIGIPSSSSPGFSVEILKKVRATCPDIAIYISDASSAAIYEWLQEGVLDFALIFNLPDDPRLTARPVRAEQFCMVSQAVPGAESGDIAFDAIFDLPLATSCRSTPWRKMLDEIAERSGRSFSPVLETESTPVMLALARQGLCHAIVPMSGTKQDASSASGLHVRRIVEPEIHGLLSLAHLSTMQLTEDQRKVRDIILEVGQADERDLSGNDLETHTCQETASKAAPTTLFPDRYRTMRSNRPH